MRTASDGHVGDVAGLIASAMRAAGGELVMSGRAQSIKLVRDRLRVGITSKPANNAYWSVGKVGLD